MDGQVNNVAFFSGNISDDTGLEKEKIYKIKANVTDTFSLVWIIVCHSNFF